MATTDDFGRQGGTPSHPLLLDWLADEFLTNGWSRKQLIRTIVLSSTYCQSSNRRTEAYDVDPNNRLLAHQNRRRLEAEIVRDQYLAAADLMNCQIGGPGFRPPLPQGLDRIGFRLSWKADKGHALHRRGMYIFYRRNLAYPMLKTFDHPNSNETCTRRERSNTPLQALSLLNDGLVIDSARALGHRLAFEADLAGRVDLAYSICLSRRPGKDERKILMNLYAQFVDLYRRDARAAKALVAGKLPNRVSLEQYAASIALARTIMNLDEFITRE